jgi:hypothetical protein
MPVAAAAQSVAAILATVWDVYIISFCYPSPFYPNTAAWLDAQLLLCRPRVFYMLTRFIIITIRRLTWIPRDTKNTSLAPELFTFHMGAYYNTLRFIKIMDCHCHYSNKTAVAIIQTGLSPGGGGLFCSMPRSRKI